MRKDKIRHLPQTSINIYPNAKLFQKALRDLVVRMGWDSTTVFTDQGKGERRGESTVMNGMIMKGVMKEVMKGVMKLSIFVIL